MTGATHIRLFSDGCAMDKYRLGSFKNSKIVYSTVLSLQRVHHDFLILLSAFETVFPLQTDDLAVLAQRLCHLRLLMHNVS